MIHDQLRLRPGQEVLTPEQEAEARRFADERIAAQLSTEPVNEPETEALVCQAYQVAGLAPPQGIHWFDGPLQLVAALALPHVGDDVSHHVRATVRDRVDDSLGDCVGHSVWASISASIDANFWLSVEFRVKLPLSVQVSLSARASMDASIDASVQAYEDADTLAFYRFLDEYLAPNDLHALAHFNERVSGYWLGRKETLLVRRPNVLSRDGAGFLHSATGPCIAYHDGWGFYAWHGARVPERVILAPETLTWMDFLAEPNVEVRRVMLEQMGEYLVSELGVVLDSGPRGTLYEVALPDDPERVARYVRVQGTSTELRYFLRVPPTLQTAAEAVAWTFQVAGDDYRPAQEP